MKKNNDIELLSAYIDNELSAEQTKELEQKLALSSELKKKLEELREIKKLTKGSIPPLPDSPYFETKLMANLSEEKPKTFFGKNWLPVGAIAVLTIALMAVLKFNPTFLDEIWEQQKTNLAALYKENLRPLLFAADISNEDIFNFAFYKQLPLDREKQQYLELGYSPEGEEFFELKTSAIWVDEKDNLEKFSVAFDFSEDERKQMDSILESYADEIPMQVLINDQNTVAINPNIWNLNKVIAADILSFAEKTNKKVYEKVIPTAYALADAKSVGSMVRQVKSSSDNNYIFVTPDTIFLEKFDFDKEEFKVEMEKMRTNLDKDLAELDKELQKLQVNVRVDKNITNFKKDVSWGKNFVVSIDSNYCRVNLTSVNVPRIALPDFDSLGEQIEKATRHIQTITVSVPKVDKIIEGYNFNFETDESGKNFRINTNIPNVDSIVQIELQKVDSIYGKNNQGFHFKFDSLGSNFKVFIEDSLVIFNRKEFEKQMKEFEKEMKKFRKEMNELRNNIKVPKTPAVPDSKAVKVIEI